VESAVPGKTVDSEPFLLNATLVDKYVESSVVNIALLEDDDSMIRGDVNIHCWLPVT
jgi:hypothetical protein